MIKRRPTIPQLVAMIVFALSSFSALLFLWVSFGGPVPLSPKGYRFTVLVPEATQLATTADVRISGVNVGKVVRLQPGSDDRTLATVQIDARYAPIPRATRAVLRSKTLLGETYLELAPNRRAPGGMLPDGGALRASAVEPTVELDEILSTFDPRTRQAFRTWMQAQSRAIDGRAADISASFAELPGFVEETDRLMATLDAQQLAVRRAVDGTGRVFGALAARDGDLRGLVSSADQAFSAIARRDAGLAELFRRLPRFEREVAATLPPITALARRRTPTLRRLGPVADELGPALAALRRLSPELEGLLRRLDPTITASRRGLPALGRTLQDLPVLLDALQPFLRTVDPAIRHLAVVRRDLTSFLGNVTAATQGRAPTETGRRPQLNYLRVAQTLSPEGLSFQRRPFGMSRRNAYVRPGGMDELARGLESLSTAGCDGDDPAPPTETDPGGLVDVIVAYVFRTTGRDVARPPCRQQGPQPGYGTAYPRLIADPPITDAGATR